MEKNKLAKSANSETSVAGCAKNVQLSKALDVVGKILDISHGSVTIFFRNGRWSPRLEIQKTVQTEIEPT